MQLILNEDQIKWLENYIAIYSKNHQEAMLPLIMFLRGLSAKTSESTEVAPEKGKTKIKVTPREEVEA